MPLFTASVRAKNAIGELEDATGLEVMLSIGRIEQAHC
jgi:hypothetical protein